VRMRRERDILLQQRDELRLRISRLVEEQNKLLDELATQSSRPTVSPTDVIQKVRESRDSDVIDIPGAEVMTNEAPEETARNSVRPPRIQPVPVPPPVVHTL